MILLHLISLKNKFKNVIFVRMRGSLWRSTDSKIQGRSVEVYFVFLLPTQVLLCLQKLLNYHNNLAAVVFIHIHCCTEVHQTLFQSWFAYYDPSTAHHPFSSLNIRYLAFFSSVFRKRKGKKNLDSAALILLGGLVIGVYVIGFYSVRCFPINPCQSKVSRACYQANRNK